MQNLKCGIFFSGIWLVFFSSLPGSVVGANAESAANANLSRGDRYSGTRWASRSPVISQHGMAATEQPLASEIAIEILKKGGSAIDAAIAANAAIGLMQPTSSGIGGDLFAIIWDPKTRKLYGYNGSGRAPRGRDLAKMKTEVRALATKNGLPVGDQIPLYGSLPVTVPGAVDAWFALHLRFGKLKIADDLAPAIKYAQSGFPLTQLVAQDWNRNLIEFSKNRTQIEEFDNAQHTYWKHRAPMAEGEVFANADLAKTLASIASGGRDAFYTGKLARVMDRYFRRIGGDLRLADFVAHHGEWVTPLSVNYRGYDVFELPPNGQGVAVLQILQIINGFDLAKMGAGSADTLTAMIEAKRLVYEDLAKWFADPNFVKVPLSGLLSAAYATDRRKLIDLQRPKTNIGPGDPRLFSGDTTYLTIADKDGMIVSLIQSNYLGMGSGLVADGLGFMFQDRGELFSLDANAANVYAAGKRPFHTLIPGFVLKDGQPYLSFGVMGGDMQPQGHVQVLTDIIDFKLNIQEAGDVARWRHYGGSEPTGEPAKGIGTLEVERGIDSNVRAALGKRGYQVIDGEFGFGGYQAIMVDAKNHVYWGASEMRKDGEVIGY